MSLSHYLKRFYINSLRMVYIVVYKVYNNFYNQVKDLTIHKIIKSLVPREKRLYNLYNLNTVLNQFVHDQFSS